MSGERELASVYARSMIESLLQVHALSNMYRSSDKEEYRESAAAWLPMLEQSFNSLKYDLTKKLPPESIYYDEDYNPHE